MYVWVLQAECSYERGTGLGSRYGCIEKKTHNLLFTINPVVSGNFQITVLSCLTFPSFLTRTQGWGQKGEEEVESVSLYIILFLEDFTCDGHPALCIVRTTRVTLSPEC